ncbi:hypothetical protein ACIQ9R_35995 [Streptomyces sp. NPDC094447]|uniref:hypothetical protein n=1 Tax=Streptomyces sp. NPDC094447 TaxID=3366062 RepID=UPI0037FBFC7C
MNHDYDVYEQERLDRERRRSNLEHIRAYYGLEARCGIRVDIGIRVRSEGHEGTVVDTAGQYLVVQRDGEERPVKLHVTSGMEYETDAGWVSASPRPTPAYPGAAG